MNLTRTIGRLLFAASLLVLAQPTLVAAQTKQFSLAASPTDVGTGPVPAPGMSVRIKNETPNGNSTINSVTVTVPQGFALTAAPTKTYPGNLTWTANSFTITDMPPLKPGKFFFVSLPGVTAAGASCGAAAWSGVAWTGSGLTGNTFARVTASGLPAGYTETTNVSGTLSLAFVTSSLPTSFFQGDPFQVSVNQVSSCGGSLPPVAVTLTATGASFTGSTVTGSGTILLTGTFNAVGNAVTLTASSPGYLPATTSSFTVFENGDLACATTPPLNPGDPGYFSASAGGAASVFETGYVVGYRGPNVKGATCGDADKVNWTFVNNLLGATTLTDPNGNKVPVNGVSMVWDRVSQPKAAFSYTVTWRAEYVDAVTGLPSRKTKLCMNEFCTATRDAKFCLGTALDPASLPFYSPPYDSVITATTKMPACMTAEVAAVAVLEVGETCLPPVNEVITDPPQACVRVSTTFTDIFDPVFIR